MCERDVKCVSGREGVCVRERKRERELKALHQQEPFVVSAQRQVHSFSTLPFFLRCSMSDSFINPYSFDSAARLEVRCTRNHRRTACLLCADTENHPVKICQVLQGSQFRV